MENKLYHAISLLDSYSAADIAVSGDKTTIPGLPAIFAPARKVKAVTVVTGVAETLQILYVSLAATMVAGTRYELGLTFADEEYEGQRLPHMAVAYDPLALTGTSATDKHNMYYSLAYKINNTERFRKKVTAHAVFTLAQTNVTPFTVGNIVVGAVSGARGLVLTSAATLVLSGVVGYSSVFNGSEALTEVNTSGVATAGAASASGACTLGVRLELRDKTGYYGINDNRGGVTLLTAASGFAQTDITVNTAGVTALLTGARIAAMIPVKEYTSENISKGYADHGNLNNQPTVGNTYNFITIEVEETLSTTGISDASNQQGAVRNKYGLYLNAADGDYAATLAAIQALVS